MRIFGEQGWRDVRDRDKTRKSGAGRAAGASSAGTGTESTVSFSDIFTQATSAGSTRDQIQGLMRELDSLGDTLARDPAPHRFEEYRAVVRRLLNVAVPEAFGVSTQLHTKRTPNSKDTTRVELKILEVLDTELESLLAMVREREHDRFALVAKMSSIKGLLVNLTR